VPKPAVDLSGILLVDKPGLDAAAPGAANPPTSHDIVQRVRRLSRQRRIGHAGTLDPLASGLLVLCLGWATRLVEFYQAHDKQYAATLVLGRATDTYDAQGQVTATAPVPPLTAAQIDAALAGFRGTVAQRPPVFSALKQGGESLHYKARRGEAVEAPLRTVTFHAINLLAFEPPDTVRLRVRCSAGAYIRSLAHDLGQALGTLATLTALRREAAGAFRVEQAHALADLEAAAAGGLAAWLLPPGAGLDLPALVVDDEARRRLGHGQVVALPAPGVEAAPGALAQAQDAAGALLGIVRRLPDAEASLWRAEKWFV
jgi:tRNA pseudouridine55 synthase